MSRTFTCTTKFFFSFLTPFPRQKVEQVKKNSFSLALDKTKEAFYAMKVKVIDQEIDQCEKDATNMPENNFHFLKMKVMKKNKESIKCLIGKRD